MKFEAVAEATFEEDDSAALREVHDGFNGIHLIAHHPDLVERLGFMLGARWVGEDGVITDRVKFEADAVERILKVRGSFDAGRKGPFPLKALERASAVYEAISVAAERDLETFAEREDADRWEQGQRRAVCDARRSQMHLAKEAGLVVAEMILWCRETLRERAPTAMERESEGREL